MSDVPDDKTGAAAETRAEKINRLVKRYSDRAASNLIADRFGEQRTRNAVIIASSMYALAVELGLVDIEEQP